MKKILLILLLIGNSLWAQIPLPPGTPSPIAPTPAAPTPNPAADPSVVAITPMNKFNLSEADLEKVYGKDEINFKAVTIDEFLTVYADTVNRTILRPATLPAPTITLRNQTPITRREAILLLDAVLGINGIAMIPVGDKFVKAVPIGEATAAGGSIEHGDAKNLPELGPYVTHVVQLHYVKPSAMLPIIQPFAKIPNSILPIEDNGILVIRDFSENVKRMLEMIAQVDVNVPEVFVSEVIQIKYALASDIASALNSLGGGGGGTSIGSGGGSSRGTGSRSGGSRGGGLGGGGIGGGGLGAQGNNYQNPGGQGGIGTQGNAPSFTDRLKSIMNKATPAGAAGSSGGGDIQVFGQTKIIADERMNALLIYATKEDMKTIKEIIDKLDVVLAQVLIESVILGVSGNNSLDLGVSAARNHVDKNGNTVNAGVANNSPDQFSQWLSSNAIPAVGGLAYYGKIDDNWQVAIKAVAGDGKTEVLQKPRIMTTHAKPGHFFVGDTVPYVTSTYYGGGYGGGPSSSYQQLRVGIDITVTPFINPDGLVLMEIDQQIEQLGDSVVIQGVGEVPKTTSRSLSSEIAVRDKETILLGGFISSSSIKSKSGVPLLKDIPALGVLFRTSSSKKDRSELMVLMRPTVMKTPELAALHSAEEQAKSPGISRFEKNLRKEQEDFEKHMDKLDGVKLRKPPTESYDMPQGSGDTQAEHLRRAIKERQEENDRQNVPPAPKPIVPPGETTPPRVPDTEPAPSKPLTPPAETTPTTPQSQSDNQESIKPSTQAAAKTADPFKTVQPMTDEEIKAFGRAPGH